MASLVLVDPIPLPADDPTLVGLDIAGLDRRWAEAAGSSPISAEAMTGADRRAQALGVPGERLMEHAGSAVGAAARALAAAAGRLSTGPVVVLAGPGNNGGDGLVAARWLAHAGLDSVVVLVAPAARPSTPDAERNWDRLDGLARVRRMHAATARDLHVLERGIERTAVVIDALLGTGVRGLLREPIRSAVELCRRARTAGVPVLAVDTPTGVDLTSGELTDPVVRADVTVTFHRPKTGLLVRRGKALAGRVLVAPIGIPRQADHD
jgi:NAD(P)H-hydrate epimerase